MDSNKVREMQDGWSLLIGQARIIAMLPLERWLEQFEKAETLGPILDPTLYRDYIYDPEERGELLKGLIRAAIPLKREILNIQDRYAKALATSNTMINDKEKGESS